MFPFTAEDFLRITRQVAGRSCALPTLNDRNPTLGELALDRPIVQSIVHVIESEFDLRLPEEVGAGDWTVAEFVEFVESAQLVGRS